MFAQLNPATAVRQRWLRTGSVIAHGALLAWLLHAPEPERLQPSTVLLGQNGRSVTRLFWPTKNPDDSTHSSSDLASQKYRHQRLSQKLAFKAPVQVAKLAAPEAPRDHSESEDKSKTQTLSAEGHGAPAGARYGSPYRGSLFGDDVRPALPITTADPVVYPWQLPKYGGNEVIEITIDERGEIVKKTVLVSLGSDIDTKCMAALENWHFQPATKNGAPIPSKQDAIFPFRSRG
jgi:outer membrane biosynthesis protein TonB